MLFVAAAGNESANNDTTPEYPASYNAANLIAVAATTSSDGLASFSNFGASSVDLGAPGVNIRSTVRGAAYAYFSGTSMATPHVSGAAALILSRCALNTASLRSLLLSSVDPVGALAGITSTGGRLNVEAALAACATALVAVSATPASGTGGIQTFSYAFSDSKGFADIASAQVVINGTLSGVNGCYLYYARAANAIWLVNDAATQYVGPLTLGAQGTLQNSQCVVDASASSAFGSGNTLTLNLALSFKAAFAGAKTNFMLVANNAGEVSGWQAKGTWTVTAAGNAPPAAVSVTPGSGSGPSQTFSYVFSDANGFADISAAQLLVNGGLNAANGCYLYYGRAANTIWLANDAGTQYVGSKTLGVAGTLQNNQCVVDAGASSASGVGNALTLNVALSFTPAFAGTKTNFMFVADNAGALSGWQAKGTWGVVAGGNAPPTAGSVTPGSGTGASQTFSYVFSDTNGVSDISSAQLVISAGLSAVNSCYLYYARAANAVWLANDAGTQWLGPKTLGVAATLQNSQCVVNAGASSASGAGNTLTLNVALSFKPAFAGPKNNYVFVADNAGAMAGWLARGTWTVP
jgi:hypothetical protein